MTIEQFNGLPLLLSRSEAMEVLGVRHKRTLETIRESHPELAVRLPGTKRWAYRKLRLAKLAGVALEVGSR
jgi:hypothetical protein